MSSDKVSNDTGSNARATIAGHIGNYRWVICALLFFSTTINYIDRNSLSVLKTTLQHGHLLFIVGILRVETAL